LFKQEIFLLPLDIIALPNLLLIVFNTAFMGFEEFFETREKHPGNYREDRYPADNRYVDYSRRTPYGEGEQFNWLVILEKIKSNKKLRIFALMAGVLLLIIVIVLILVLLPVIIKLINSISQTGLQGILKDVTGFIDKIMKGIAN
jgi:hypothetical protein